MENNYTVRDVLNDCLLIDEALARIARHREETGVSVIGLQLNYSDTGRAGFHIAPGITQLALEVGAAVASGTWDCIEYPYKAKFRYAGMEFFQIGETPEDAAQ